jgi:hypothetical protein
MIQTKPTIWSNRFWLIWRDQLARIEFLFGNVFKMNSKNVINVENF